MSDSHDHHDHHGHDHHGHFHGQARETEEPLDPASQSLADALRASFRLLKLIMVFVVVLFCFSGVFVVDQEKEVALLLRLGKEVGVYREGINWGWPYPVGQVVKIPVASQNLEVPDFWLNIAAHEKDKRPSELRARGAGLNPARDGALLTGDQSLMHASLTVRYHIENAGLFYRNVGMERDEVVETQGQAFLKVVIENAAIASAARLTSDQIAKESSTLAALTKSRAQNTLDALQSGIRLESVHADEAYYPLQVKDAVVNVSRAENVLNEAIQFARKAQQERMNEAAGPAWEELRDEIAKLDRTPKGQRPDTRRIEEILMTRSAGKAGEIINEAERKREQIDLMAQARLNEFNVLRDAYKAQRELFRQMFQSDVLKDLYAQSGVKKWVLPGGDKQVVLWLNPDPKEYREAELERIRKDAAKR